MSDYISKCNFVPYGKTCSKKERTISSLKRDISEGKKLVKIFIWNKAGDIVDILSMSNYKSKVLSKSREKILFIHDIGESACSERMKNLVKKSYAKKPEAVVMSLDYSLVVSTVQF